MPLDPQIQAQRDQRERSGAPPLYTLSLDAARAADLAAIRAAGGTPEPVHQIVEIGFHGPNGFLTLRFYRPVDEVGLPALLYCFGGGWVLGSIDTADAVARALANATGALVAVPGYRLAPEHPFPAGLDDCYAALRFLLEDAALVGVDPRRLAVGGDSAGGNLAAALALRARDDGLQLAAQLLVYPNTDQLANDASMRANGDPYLFNHHSVRWYRKHYLSSPEHAFHPLASPLRAPTLKGLPPAMIITAEYDPLRDQAEEYATRLVDEGVPTHLVRYPGMAHGFFTSLGTVGAARRAVDEAAAWLRLHLRRV